MGLIDKTELLQLIREAIAETLEETTVPSQPQLFASDADEQPATCDTVNISLSKDDLYLISYALMQYERKIVRMHDEMESIDVMPTACRELSKSYERAENLNRRLCDMLNAFDRDKD